MIVCFGVSTRSLSIPSSRIGAVFSRLRVSTWPVRLWTWFLSSMIWVFRAPSCSDWSITRSFNSFIRPFCSSIRRFFSWISCRNCVFCLLIIWTDSASICLCTSSWLSRLLKSATSAVFFRNVSSIESAWWSVLEWKKHGEEHRSKERRACSEEERIRTNLFPFVENVRRSKLVGHV